MYRWKIEEFVEFGAVDTREDVRNEAQGLVLEGLKLIVIVTDSELQPVSQLRADEGKISYSADGK